MDRFPIYCCALALGNPFHSRLPVVFFNCCADLLCLLCPICLCRAWPCRDLLCLLLSHFIPFCRILRFLVVFAISFLLSGVVMWSGVAILLGSWHSLGCSRSRCSVGVRLLLSFERFSFLVPLLYPGLVRSVWACGFRLFLPAPVILYSLCLFCFSFEFCDSQLNSLHFPCRQTFHFCPSAPLRSHGSPICPLQLMRVRFVLLSLPFRCNLSFRLFHFAFASRVLILQKKASPWCDW